MKKLSITLVLVLVASLILLVGCAEVRGIVSPGPTITRDYDYKDFSKIEISSAFKVDVLPSDSFAISISANEDLFDHIQVIQSGDTLKIFMEWDLGAWNSSRPGAKISLPELTGLKLSGASSGSATGFSSSNDLDVTLSGASNLNLDIEAGKTALEVTGASRITGHLKAQDTSLEINGASKVELSGSGNDLNLNVSGASKAGLDELTVNDVHVVLSGASHGEIAASGKADIYLSGASSLDYSGNPDIVRLDISGASKITRKS